jgi:hypothetical protein
MKHWKLGLFGLFALGGLAGVMALTNPERTAYEEYAVQQLEKQAMEQCEMAAIGLSSILQGPCRAAIETVKPQLLPLVSASTNRQNLILFSLYRSDISVPYVKLTLKVESIGMFNSFYTYKFG